MKNIISLIIFIIYLLVIEPFFHEMGHAFQLKKIEKYAAVSFCIPFFSKFKVDFCGIDIFNIKNRKYKNITYSKSDYLGLCNEDIIKSVNGGLRNSYCVLVALVIVSIIYRLKLLGVFSACMLLYFIYEKYLSKKYNDFDIKKNPEEFIDRIKKYDKNSELLYKNLIKEYQKQYANHQ